MQQKQLNPLFSKGVNVWYDYIFVWFVYNQDAVKLKTKKSDYDEACDGPRLGAGQFVVLSFMHNCESNGKGDHLKKMKVNLNDNMLPILVSINFVASTQLCFIK